MGLRQWIKDFRNGLSLIFGKASEGEGDRKLAKMAKIVEGQIDVYGKRAVRAQVIKSIESDLKRAAKKGKTEELIQKAFATPEYKKMLHRLGLEKPHIKVMEMGALKNAD